MTADRRYDAVFWDLGGVVVDLASVREGYAAFLAELAERHPPDVADPQATWTEELGAHFRGRDGTEYRTAAEGYRRATAALYDDPPPESVWGPLFEEVTRAALRPEPGAVETLRALDDAGVYQAAVSDVDTAEAVRMLETFGVRELFTDLTTSEAVGYTKPDARMFETALAKAPVGPDRVVMVGDRYEHDVEGASDAGIDAVAYGADAAGPAADHEIDDLAALLDVVGVR